MSTSVATQSENCVYYRQLNWNIIIPDH